MITRTVPVPGGQLHVIDERDPAGQAILLPDAGIADLTAWDALVRTLAAAGHRVIRYDPRGFGKSVTDDVEYSNRSDAIAVLDALRIEHAALVGNSRGGQIAFDTAIEYPDRVLAAVGAGAGLGGFEGDATPDEIAAFERLDALEERLDAAGPAGDPEAHDAVLDLDIRLWVDGPGQPADRVPAAIRDHVWRMDLAHNDPARVHGRPGPLTPPAAERPADLRCPAVAVAGALGATEVTLAARHLARTRRALGP